MRHLAIGALLVALAPPALTCIGIVTVLRKLDAWDNPWPWQVRRYP